MCKENRSMITQLKLVSAFHCLHVFTKDTQGTINNACFVHPQLAIKYSNAVAPIGYHLHNNYAYFYPLSLQLPFKCCWDPLLVTGLDLMTSFDLRMKTLRRVVKDFPWSQNRSWLEKQRDDWTLILCRFKCCPWCWTPDPALSAQRCWTHWGDLLKMKRSSVLIPLRTQLSSAVSDDAFLSALAARASPM